MWCFLIPARWRDNAEQKVINRLEQIDGIRRKHRPGMIIGVLGVYGRTFKERLIDEHHADVVCCRPRLISRST